MSGAKSSSAHVEAIPRKLLQNISVHAMRGANADGSYNAA